MGRSSWPSDSELNHIRNIVSGMSGRSPGEVRVVVSPYRICPLGAHIDHQVITELKSRGEEMKWVDNEVNRNGKAAKVENYIQDQGAMEEIMLDLCGRVGGSVLAMTINKGVLLGFVPSGDSQVLLHSEQFKGEVKFSVDEIQHPRHTAEANGKKFPNCSTAVKEESSWGNYARGAQYALQSRGNHISQGIIGYICGSEGLDSSGLSSSAAVGIAYLLAFENANNLSISPTENIEYDRLIENEYLGLRNGILDQSAILLSSYGCLTYMNCKTKEHKLIHLPKPQKDGVKLQNFKILLAFSGLKQALTTNPGYNRRVDECREAARVLLNALGNSRSEPVLSNVDPEVYESYKCNLEPNLAKRAEHYFSENMRVLKGLEAWTSGNFEDFGKLISASGLSSIENYECGAEPLIQLYEILLRAPGIFGARFSGAGFRGCCLAFVDADRVTEAATFVREEYAKCQSKLSAQLNKDTAVLICEGGDSARII